MAERVQVGGLSVAEVLHRFVVDEALPGSGIDPDAFWAGADAIIHDLTPRNRELLARREEFQAQLDGYYREHPGAPTDIEAHEAWLREIGYLVDEPGDFTIATSGVDREVAEIAGPQLVVPMLNARFALNAANARWGSLYDALYGTDVIPDDGDLAKGSTYNTTRGAEVVKRGRALLDEHVPLADGSHADATSYAADGEGLAVTVGGSVVRLADPAQYVGHRGGGGEPEAYVLVHHGLHIEILVDPEDSIGATDQAFRLFRENRGDVAIRAHADPDQVEPAGPVAGLERQKVQGGIVQVALQQPEIAGGVIVRDQAIVRQGKLGLGAAKVALAQAAQDWDRGGTAGHRQAADAGPGDDPGQVIRHRAVIGMFGPDDVIHTSSCRRVR